MREALGSIPAPKKKRQKKNVSMDSKVRGKNKCLKVPELPAGTQNPMLLLDALHQYSLLFLLP
jgi:hypothetical protein